MSKDGIKVFGHKGTWYVIDQSVYEGKDVFLLEHEQLGDMADCLIVDSHCNVIRENVENGLAELND